MTGYSAPDWESWGDGGALDDLSAMDCLAGTCGAMHWAAASDDGADDELEDAFPGSALALSLCIHLMDWCTC